MGSVYNTEIALPAERVTCSRPSGTCLTDIMTTRYAPTRPLNTDDCSQA
jgi:hypothetical protein